MFQSVLSHYKIRKCEACPCLFLEDKNKADSLTIDEKDDVVEIEVEEEEKQKKNLSQTDVKFLKTHLNEHGVLSPGLLCKFIKNFHPEMNEEEVFDCVDLFLEDENKTNSLTMDDDDDVVKSEFMPSNNQK